MIRLLGIDPGLRLTGFGVIDVHNHTMRYVASGVIKVDVADAQKYALSDAQRAHEVLESRATQGSSLLIP